MIYFLQIDWTNHLIYKPKPSDIDTTNNTLLEPYIESPYRRGGTKFAAGLSRNQLDNLKHEYLQYQKTFLSQII